ncbi:MAG: NAD(P)-dependent oxidoreductase [Actinomycetota bacterium]|nr:NAD(P)-dependent oxidoreductase [Actinomycetota bacterium]
MKIGFIGLGVMGAPMATNLLKAGYEVTVHNRTRSKEEPLEIEGAGRAEDPSQAAEEADILITMVGDTPDVEQVLFGVDGAADSMPSGGVIADMSTIDPGATAQMSKRLSLKGISLVDAPVSGGSEGAAAGTLSIMAGGDEAAFQRVLPVFEVLGSRITYIGPSGSGQLAKAINQVIIAGTFQSVAEGMKLGMANGLDMNKVIEALGGGAAASWVLSNRSQRMVANEYPLGFKLRLHRKDLSIALATAEGVGLDLPIAKKVAAIEDALISQGFGDEDMSALARAIEPNV